MSVGLNDRDMHLTVGTFEGGAGRLGAGAFVALGRPADLSTMFQDRQILYRSHV